MNLKTVIGTILVLMSILVFAGSFERERAGFHPTNIYAYSNGIGILLAGSALIVWGLVRRK